VLYRRKFNVGAPPPPAIAFEVRFSTEATVVRRVDGVDVADLAAGLPLWKRIQTALRRGPRPVHEIAKELNAATDSVKKALERGGGQRFMRLTDTTDGIHRWALIENRRDMSLGHEGTCPADQRTDNPPL
jgi:hypothetical protein